MAVHWVNRMDTYRRTKTKQWTSHSRDLLENVKRYYNNSLLDADKQAAMDLFLGVRNGDLSAPALSSHPQRLTGIVSRLADGLHDNRSRDRYDIWTDYYKPHLLSQFQRLYTFTMNSTSKTSLWVVWDRHHWSYG
jgi:hypothetical protein